MRIRIAENKRERTYHLLLGELSVLLLEGLLLVQKVIIVLGRAVGSQALALASDQVWLGVLFVLLFVPVSHIKDLICLTSKQANSLRTQKSISAIGFRKCMLSLNIQKFGLLPPPVKIK